MYSKVAEAAILAFNRHTSYLCEEYIPILLYSDEVSDIEETDLVNDPKYFESSSTSRLLKRHEISVGKPEFPVFNSLHFLHP